MSPIPRGCRAAAAAVLPLLAACPIELVAVDDLRFACEDDGECSDGFRCREGVCTPIGAAADGGMADTGSADGATTDGGRTDGGRTDGGRTDGGRTDAGQPDGGRTDAGRTDAGRTDAGGTDAGTADAGRTDAGRTDAGRTDVGRTDVGRTDVGPSDVGSSDVGPSDIGLPDTGLPDTGLPDTLPPDWWDPSFGWRQKLVFDNSQQAEALVDFPVLVALDDGVVDFARIEPLGADLRFVDADGTGPLPHEIERWDEAGTCVIWVQVPQIDASSDADFIWMYYGKPGAEDGQQVSAVWSNGYVGVWHMDADCSAGADAVRDSSPSGRHGTCRNMSSGDLVDGYLGRALDFDGSNDIVDIDGSAASGDPLDFVSGPMTASAWVDRDDYVGSLVARRDGSDCQWQLAYDDMITNGNSNPQLLFQWANASDSFNVWVTDDSYTGGDWEHFAVVVGEDFVPVAFYANGTSRSFFRDSDSGGVPTHRSIDVSLGARWSGAPSTDGETNGVLDEVRVANVARSEAWMAAQHLSMTNSFVSFVPAEPL